MRNTSCAVAVLSVLLGACASTPRPVADTTPPTQALAQEEVRLDGMTVDPTLPGEAPDAVPPLGPNADAAMVVQQAQRRVRADFPKIRGCYDNAYLTNRNLAGSVILRFTLIPSGQISQPRDAGSTLADKSVIDCVENTLIRTKFDAYNGPGVQLYVPLKFSPPLSRTADTF